jgi:hypothetical protein
MFSPERNDPTINSYNRLIIIVWLTNTDIILYTSSQVVINYISKYYIKLEKKTISYTNILKEVLPYISSRNSMLSIISRFINKLLGEYNYSVGEVYHLLLDIPL